MKPCNIIFLIVAVIEMNCSDSCKKEELVLILDPNKSVIADTTFYVDRIVINYPKCDSFSISKAMNQGFVSVGTFTVDDDANVAYENKTIKDFDGKILGVEKTIAFARKDTSDIYEFNLTKYPPVSPNGSDDFRYKVIKISDNEFATIRENLMDTLFRDTIYYDSNFMVNKIVIRDKKNLYRFKLLH